MFHLYTAINHAWMAIYIVVLCNTDWLYWFSNAFAYFRLNRMSGSRKGLWSTGIKRMKLKRNIYHYKALMHLKFHQTDLSITWVIALESI